MTSIAPGRLGRILNGADHARGGEEEDQHDEGRNHGPGELHLVAAINLRRLAAIVVSTLAEFRDGVCQQAENNGKNKARDRQDEQR